MSKFIATHNKGFQMKFENGFSISVQWGPGNYCEKKNTDFHAPMKDKFWESISAEIAIFDKDGGLVQCGTHDNVSGWLSTDTVAKCIAIVQSSITKEEMTEKIKTLGL